MNEFQFPSSRQVHIREERATTAGHDWSNDEDINQFFKSDPSVVCSSDSSSDEESDENPNGSSAPRSQQGANEDDSKFQSDSSDSDTSLPRRLINVDKPEVLEMRLRSEQHAFEEEQKSAEKR